MTPEERFTKIENFLFTVAEHQAHQPEGIRRHSEEIQQLREMQTGMVIAITKVAEAQKRAAEAQQQTEEKLRTLAEQQQITGEKLHALIDTVDRIIRNRE